MATKTPIYLDHNATTPLDPRVLEEMRHSLSHLPLNPSSSHFLGRQASKILRRAREEIARFFGVKPREIVFTSGGTESMNFLIQGVMSQRQNGHLITSNLDHACVYETALQYAKRGFQVTFLSPGRWGAPTVQEVEKALRSNTSLIVLSAANSETGVCLAVEEIAQLARSMKIPLILDGVGLLGRAPFPLPLDEGIQGVGFSGHKIHGPTGIGFCIVRESLGIIPQMHGGGQENGRRSGTENLLGIVGLQKALSLLFANEKEDLRNILFLRNHLERGLREVFPSLKVNGEGPRTTNTSNLAFPGMEGEILLSQLDRHQIAVSHGSACSSGSLQPSRILLNMGFSMERAASSIRFSLSRLTTREEIEQTIKVIAHLKEQTDMPL